MKLIKPSIKIIKQNPGLEGIEEMVNLAKWNSKTPDESTCNNFGMVYLKFPKDLTNISPFPSDPSTTVSNIVGSYNYTTTSYGIVKLLAAESWLKYLCDKPTHFMKKTCAEVTVDRETALRLLTISRDVLVSFKPIPDDMEEVEYIIPKNLYDKLPEGNYDYWDGDWCDTEDMKILYGNADNIKDPINDYLFSIQKDETAFKSLVYNGVKPKDAIKTLSLSSSVTFLIISWDFIFNTNLKNILDEKD